MSAKIRAEIVKLARLLGDEPERFSYLADLPLEDLRVIRERATDVLFSANRGMFERIAAASKLVPVAVTTTVAQKSFGPLLCARIAGVLEPERAVEMAGRLPVEFLADVAAELDPRRAAGVLAALPAAKVVEVGTELTDRGDYVSMGRFIGELPDATLRVVVQELDADAILRTAVYSENDDRFAAIFAMVPDSRIPDVLDVVINADASTVDDLADDVLPVLAALDEAGLTRLATAVDALTPDQRARLVDLAAKAGVTDQLGPLGLALSA
ncbi:hypothetical protein SAMN05192558_12037 [Actinokineospora alba]|uniref:MgtE intracellular N domain-containing protein n=1 Tax=Actinokineospora alba TaxID=504798 RepID=A0A1H0WDX5_9PSEU|nr:hypothetical protein [Actinokineospora alba]TDP68892.1 hypothetical protein C8E96_4459 [Actinokineospora alba]SDI74375.1 hypothetical protein SAMN05421871_107162 [Actinokineospora alba]SDP88904.1 hypothetical protein SAMN05192558_12037 [Actinokineospora alba]